MKKAISLCALLIALLPSIALVVYAHPGRTDSSGGHTNRSTGEYHYHHGYSSHDHYDMDEDGDVDCPYDFDDITKHGHSSESTAKQSSFYVWGSIIAVGLYIFFMFILPYLIRSGG